jgi:hypothetical protein
MKKESVVVFNGEDKFIVPRNKVYNMKSGKTEFVGQNGVKDENVTPPTATDPTPPPPPPTGVIEDPDKGTNPPRQYGYSSGKFQMPDPTNPEFCQIVQEYITQRGHGSASPEDIMSAYNAFKKYCNSEPTPPYGGELPPKDKPKEEPKEEPKKEPDVILPIIPTTLVATNLGTPIGGGRFGGGGGGGEEEPKATEKKKNYWWLLVVALGVGAYIYYKRKK